MAMKWKRIEAGRYQSEDGRAVVYRDVSQQTRRTDETVWVVVIDGKELPFAQDTLKDAKQIAERKLSQ